MVRNQVVLVDEQDHEIGTMEKLAAHEQGKLHRAFSIFIFNSKNELILQQRATTKYHCGGLWSNTCCSHPQLGEDLITSAKERLLEEIGFTCELTELFNFIYQASFSNGLTEYEFDHVLIGHYDGEIKPNPEEVNNYKLISLENLKTDLKNNPDKYTPWFIKIINEHKII